MGYFMADLSNLTDELTGNGSAAAAIAPRVGWSACVQFRRRAVQSRWADFEWEAAAVLPEGSVHVPAGDAPSMVARDGETRWQYGAVTIELHASEGEGYWLNLNSPAPCVFVMWRMEEGESVPRPVVVTVSYNEAGRMLDAGERVDNVPMPDEMRAALAVYVDAHYRPEVRRKVKRNDPFRGQAFRRGDEEVAVRGTNE